MKRPIEPGLVKLFRYFAVIGVAYFFAHWVYEMSVKNNDLIIAQTSVFMLIHALLLVYLLIPWLERRLKDYYLPLCLVVYTLAMILGSMMYLYLPDRDLVGFMTASFSLVPIQIVPLVFIAWQYDFKHAVLYTIATNLADLAIALMIVKKVSIDNLAILAMPVIRGFAFIMVAFVVCQLTESYSRQKHRLLLANVQLSQYTNTLEHLATSRERNRLARELHDTTAHTLSGISVNLEALKTIAPTDNPELNEMIETTLAAARTGLNDTRRALGNLRAQPLDDLGLELALRQLASSTAERAGFEIDVQMDTPLPFFAPNVEQVFYRVAQEALENVARHANAKHVWMNLTQQDNFLTLLVQDDGQGFKETEQKDDDHYGIKGMRERALTIGADLTIQSKIGEGTSIKLSWERI